MKAEISLGHIYSKTSLIHTYYEANTVKLYSHPKDHSINEVVLQQCLGPSRHGHYTEVV